MRAVRACFAPSITRPFVRAHVPISSHWEARPDQPLFYFIFLAPDIPLSYHMVIYMLLLCVGSGVGLGS